MKKLSKFFQLNEKHKSMKKLFKFLKFENIVTENQRKNFKYYCWLFIIQNLHSKQNYFLQIKKYYNTKHANYIQ